MDKPQSLTMREYLVRKLAVKLMLSEKTIDAVVAHQFSSANEALHTNDSVEISGFGKFFFNQKKAIKKMDDLVGLKNHYERLLIQEDVSEEKKERMLRKLPSIDAEIKRLKLKIDD